MIDDPLLQQVVALVTEVGRYQLEKFRALPPGGGDEKLAREFVSEVDLRSETRLIEALAPLVPKAGFFGEETGQRGSRDLQWIIDPLDGTTNYLSGLDHFCISVSLVVVGTPVLGVVYRPASGELFTALRGKGLRRNGLELPPLVHDLTLSQALVGTGFPYRSPDLADAFFPCCRQVLYQSRGIRRFGSAALDLSYLAAGYLQGFWESDLQPYDVAAALLFLSERGCRISNENAEPFDLSRDRILVAGPPAVHEELQPIIHAHYGGAARDGSTPPSELG